MSVPQIVVFDLDDTLSESKTNITEAMAHALASLIEKKIVGIISGCAYTQFSDQLIRPLVKHCPSVASVFHRLYLMPSSGSQLYTWHSNYWNQKYNENLNLKEKVCVYKAFELACDWNQLFPLSTVEYGEIAEDRDSQVTFSMLGQKAPLWAKKPYDPNQLKRLRLANWMNGYFYATGNNFECTVGGASSIDVTRKGANKAYGICKFLSLLEVSADNVLFVADALFPGGNDYSVKSIPNIRCVHVKNPEETLETIRFILDKEEHNAIV